MRLSHIRRFILRYRLFTVYTNYIRINNTEDDLKNSFKIYSRHEIESKIKEIEEALSSLNRLLINHNNDILSKKIS